MSKKFFFISLIFFWCLLSIIPAFGRETIIPLTQVQNLSDKSSVLVENKTITSMTVHFDLEGIAVAEEKTKAGFFNRLSFEEAVWAGEIGEPAIPVIRKIIEIPHNTDANIRIHADQGREINMNSQGYHLPLIPVQPPIPKLPGARERAVFQFNKDAYKVDAYPTHESVRIVDIGMIRGHRIAVIEIRPVAYNPFRNSIRVLNTIDFTVEFPTADEAATKDSIRSHYTPVYDTIFDSMLLKGSSFEDFSFPPTAPVRYLVIVEDSLESALTAWVNWKIKSGYEITVVPTSVAGTTTSAIQTYLNDAYANWTNKPVFVLFVGDTNYIATYTSGSENDLGYADLDGGGYWTPDVLIGRWPARSAAHVENIVEKTLQFDQMTMPSKDYFKDSVWIGSSDHASMIEGTHEFCFDTYVDPVDPSQNVMYKVYERTGGNTADFASNVNAGRGITCYSGHGYGNGTGTASVHFVVSNVRALTNTDKYTHVMVYACGTNLYSQTESFGEVWLTEADKGSVTFWGTSDSSWWDEDDTLERKTFKSNFNENQTAIAAAHMTGLIQVHTDYGSSSSSYYFRIYNLMGDPSLDFVNRIPTNLTVTSANAIAPISQNYNVTVTGASGPVANALVGIYKDGSQLGAGYTNASGQVAIAINPGTPGTMTVRVQAHNYLPKSKSIAVQASGCGSLSLDSTMYGCSSEAVVTLFDQDLDTNSLGIDSAQVYVFSTSDPTWRIQNLTETGPSTGEFKGTVQFNASGTKATVPVADGDTFTVRYNDADCNGAPKVETDTATIDCVGPACSNVQVPDIGETYAVISWTTSESSTTWIEYCLEGLPHTMNTYFDAAMKTNHTATIQGLSPMTRYSFKIGGTDLYNNFSADDNGGVMFSFQTWGYAYFANEVLDVNPGWSLTGQWAFGQPTGQGGSYGNPDPTSGYTGNNVYGYNLNGDYPDGISSPQYLTSDTYDCSTTDHVDLQFYRWLGVESSSYDHATVEVSNNNGSTWTTIWQNGSSMSDDAWTFCNYDITSIAAGHSQVKVRWGMGTTDGSMHYCGWNIDDISLVKRTYPQVPALQWLGMLLLLTGLSLFIIRRGN